MSAAQTNMDNPTGSQRRLLLVEDERLIRERIEAAFTEWDVTPAIDGEQAIELLWSGMFDVVLLDMMLPRLSGYDVIRHMSMRRPELLQRTIVFSGANDIDTAFIEGLNIRKIIKKPAPPEVLLEIASDIAAEANA